MKLNAKVDFKDFNYSLNSWWSLNISPTNWHIDCQEMNSNFFITTWRQIMAQNE